MNTAGIYTFPSYQQDRLTFAAAQQDASTTSHSQSSPSNSLPPLTPVSESFHSIPSLAHANSVVGSLDLNELLDPALFSMSPTRGPIQHSASYTYGSEAYQSNTATGVSQERSTVSPGQDDSIELPQAQWPPKQPSIPSPTGSSWTATPQTMLPPLRFDPSHQGQEQGQGPWVYQGHNVPYGYVPQAFAQHALTHKPAHPRSSTHPNFNYFQLPPPSASSITTSAGTELYTPASATIATAYYHSPTPGTIQPSAIQAWQVDRRNGTGTVPGAFGGSPSASNAQGRSDRRTSTPSIKEEPELDGIRGGGALRTPADSPLGSGSERDEDELVDVKRGTIVYTMDSEVKQTDEIKRMCFNCQAKTPPSWRKSIIHSGKILCNKCGIFERTHHRARPPQNDDQKLRRPPQGYRRDIPPALFVSKEMQGGESPLGSPFSAVPSQGTPASATSTFNFPPHHQMIAAPATAPLQATTPQGHPILNASGTMYRRHSHAHPGLITHQQSAVRGQSDPYAHAYAQRRTASYQPIHSFSMVRTSNDSPLQSSIMTSAGQGGISPSPNQQTQQLHQVPAWNTGRRHSAVSLHQQDTSGSTASTAGTD